MAVVELKFCIGMQEECIWVQEEFLIRTTYKWRLKTSKRATISL